MSRLHSQNEPKFDPFEVDAIGEPKGEDDAVPKGGRVGNRGIQKDKQEKLDAKSDP